MGLRESLPDGWVVWHKEDGGRVVLAFRPDVFDANTFPAACLPTVTIAPGGSPDDPPERRARSDNWYVAFYLEPMVRIRELDATFPSREKAVEYGIRVARRFVNGKVAYRASYQDPRDEYLDQLDALVTRDY